MVTTKKEVNWGVVHHLSTHLGAEDLINNFFCLALCLFSQKKFSYASQSDIILCMLQESDTFCWRCRKDGTVIPCQMCPRVFHLKCLDLVANPVDDWICVECEVSQLMGWLCCHNLCFLLAFLSSFYGESGFFFKKWKQKIVTKFSFLCKCWTKLMLCQWSLLGLFPLFLLQFICC